MFVKLDIFARFIRTNILSGLKLLEKKTALHAVEVHVLVHLIVGNNVTLDICHFKKLNSLKTVKRCSIYE